MPVLSAARQGIGQQCLRRDQQVWRTLAATTEDANLHNSLAASQGAEIPHRPVQPGLAQHALPAPGRLSKRHSKEDLHRQAGLDDLIAESLLLTAFSCWRRLPNHIGIEPDRQ